MAATAVLLPIIPEATVYHADLLDQVVARLREAARETPPALRRSVTALTEQARKIAEGARLMAAPAIDASGQAPTRSGTRPAGSYRACPELLDDVVVQLNEAVFYSPAALRCSLTGLAEQAGVLAGRSRTKMSKRSTQPKTEYAAVRPFATTPEQAQRVLARLDRIARIANQIDRPLSFRIGRFVVDAWAAEIALTGRRVELRPQDKAYLFARIAAQGALTAERLRRVAPATGMTTAAFEVAYHRYRKRVAALRELADQRTPETSESDPAHISTPATGTQMAQMGCAA